MKIGLVGEYDPRDRWSWSGVPYFVGEALRACGAEVVPMGPIRPMIGRITALQNAAMRRMGLLVAVGARSDRISRASARVIQGMIARERPDAVLAPAGAGMLAHLVTDATTVYFSDATVRAMVGYYPGFTGLDAASLEALDAQERLAITRSDIVIYPSAWAAASALNDYGADPERVHVVPMGANLTEPPPRERAVGARDNPVLRLLFVGGDWVRKGGNVAADARDALAARGIAAELIVVGGRPADGQARPGVSFLGPLSKNKPDEARRLSDLYLTADFLLLPTRAEAFGIAVCDAAAHGLPTIATRTGGMPDAIRDGETGRLLPPEATGAEYADTIEGLRATPGAIDRMRRQVRQDYEDRLNWTAWARKVIGLIAAKRGFAP